MSGTRIIAQIFTSFKDTCENMINKNDEKEMKALMGIEPAHYGKWMYFLLPLTQPTELYKLISNSFENYTWLLNMPAWCFDFNVYKHGHYRRANQEWQWRNILFTIDKQNIYLYN